MQLELPPGRQTWQRPLAAATALALLLVGVLPALHFHADGHVSDEHAHEGEPAPCQDSGPLAALHFETLELEHHEPCGLCAKNFSSARLEQPLATLVDELVAEQAFEGPQMVPPGPPGRHGASRAPPAA